MGDLNVRTGAKGTIDPLTASPCINDVRCSKDAVSDGNCNKFNEFLEDIGAFILNGRGFDDKTGEYTFVSSRGSSVVDYCCLSYTALEMIRNFSVDCTTFSDHMPLILDIKTFENRLEHPVATLLPRLKWSDRRRVEYFRKIDEITTERMIPNDNIEARCLALKECIYTAYGNTDTPSIKFERKKPWFDLDCHMSRKTSLKLLKIYRKYNLDASRKHYCEANKKYKALCKTKQILYYQRISSQLSSINSAKDWWKLVKEIRGSYTSTVTQITATEFMSHFESALNSDGRQNIALNQETPAVFISQLDNPFELEEINTAITSAKDNKAPGLDGIPYEFYKNASNSFIGEVHAFFNDIYETETIPSSFKKSIIFPLFKKGDANIVSNYRGLSFLDTLYKLFTTLILNRLTTWIENNNILNEYQAAYRNNYSTIDQIYNLSCLIQLQLSERKKLYAWFVDLKAAFDNINRQALFHKLAALGLSTKMLRIIKLLYQDTVAAVWDGNKASNFFSTSKGVKQGCVLSALLFVLFLNDLHSELPIGVLLEGLGINVLLYADDIVLLADSTVKLQTIINKFSSYCRKWNLEVNLDKSEIVIFRNGGRRAASEKWYFNEAEIKIANQYKYLGVIFTYNMSWSEHLTKRLATSKNGINATWSKFVKNKYVPHSSKFKVHDAATRSIMYYCAQVWGYKEYTQVEQLQRFFIKRCFNLPDNTPNYVVHIETGLSKAFITTLYVHFAYIRKILSLQRSRLPRVLSMAVLQKNIYWAQEWSGLFQESGIVFTPNASNFEWKNAHHMILENLKEKLWKSFTDRALQSQFHDEYCNLSFTDVPNYFDDTNSREMISLILKARCGLLDLNARAFRNDTVGLCTMCNLDATENTYHFICICPIFKTYRRIFLEADTIDHTEFLNILNGKCYLKLYKFLKYALKYRNLIVNEYK